MCVKYTNKVLSTKLIFVAFVETKFFLMNVLMITNLME